MRLHVVALRSFLQSKDTCSCGETASPHVVIDVVIFQRGCCEERKKAPARGLPNLPGRGVFDELLEQIEFLSPADCCPTVVHLKLVINVLGVGPQGVQGHDEFTGNVRATQVGSEQPKHVTFTFAQWLAHQPVWQAVSALSLAKGCQKVTDIVLGDPLFQRQLPAGPPWV